MDHQKATWRGLAGCKHARGGRTVHISDICDGAEFAKFLGRTIAGWCRSSRLGFAFTLYDTNIAWNIRYHFSKTVSHRAHHQPAGSQASLQWSAMELVPRGGCGSRAQELYDATLFCINAFLHTRIATQPTCFCLAATAKSRLNSHIIGAGCIGD